MRRLSDEFAASLTPGCNAYEVDRGIVIAGGGLKCFPSVWVNVNLLRQHGCELPIQLWYMGDGKCDPYMKRLLAPLRLECVDARKVELEIPARILCGWELKPYSALHSPFAVRRVAVPRCGQRGLPRSNVWLIRKNLTHNSESTIL